MNPARNIPAASTATGWDVAGPSRAESNAGPDTSGRDGPEAGSGRRSPNTCVSLTHSGHARCAQHSLGECAHTPDAAVG